MTLSATDTEVQYTGTGLDSALSTAFKYFVDANVVVTKRVTATGADSTMALGTHYSIAGGSTTGAVGTVTVINGTVNFPTSVTWTIKRVIPITQATDYVENDLFPAASHEIALDRLTMQVQDVDARKSLAFPTSDGAMNPQIPSSVDRANKVLSFTSTGAPSVATQTTVGYGKVLLSTVTASGDANIEITEEDWNATYDSVELELVALVAGGVTHKLTLNPIDTGVVQTTNMSIMESLNTAGTVTTPTGTDWQLDLAQGSSGPDDAVNGTATFTANAGYLNGHGVWTYRTTTNHISSIASYQRHDTIGARWDGFKVWFGTGTIASGTIRLWGIPRT